MIVTARLTFSAAHRLHNPNRDAEWNRKTYGKCDNPRGHGHNYALEVSVRGRIDPETGMVIDLKELKDIMRARVIDRVDHTSLNEDVDFLRLDEIEQDLHRALEGLEMDSQDVVGRFIDDEVGLVAVGVVRAGLGRAVGNH